MRPLEEAFIDLAHAEKKDPQWVIAETIPVGLTFLAGPPKVSHKSTISLAIAALCARWPSRVLPPWMDCTLGGTTMAFSYEADAGEVRSIMEDGLGLEVQGGALYVACDPWKFQLDSAHGPDDLVKYVESRNARLVIMDPFRNMWAGDENDSGAIIRVLGPLQRWLKENEAAGIVVHHVNKPIAEGANATGSMFTMRGSSAIPGLADGILVIEPTKTEGHITIHTKFKRGPSWRRTIALGAPGYGWASQGSEVLPDLALAVREDLASSRGALDQEWLLTLAQARKQSVTNIREALRALDRNQMHTFTPMERRDILGETT